ncbi:MAG: AzlD domain-containing protein [Actinobacteria bacterium]|nr:AzlD domain-containing protein [Actinomycetota bacterium]
MSAMWWGVIGTSVAAFAFKYIGHSIPDRHMEHPKMLRVNVLIPIALLSALVAVQTLTEKTKLTFDHRVLGVGVAFVALLLKAPFPIVVLTAALSSAVLYRFG